MIRILTAVGIVLSVSAFAADPVKKLELGLAQEKPAAEVKPGNAKTAQGANLALSRAGAFVTVEEAMVESADIAATNGVVHKVDRVLMPPRR